MTGFCNILEACRNYPVDHLIYASSSSVYGANKKVPFEETDFVDHPVSLMLQQMPCMKQLVLSRIHLLKKACNNLLIGM